MPRESAARSRPTRILSRSALLDAWNSSRDSKKKAGAKGADGITARQFAANLEQNIGRIASQISKGEYRFSRLRPFPVAKPGSGKERVICIPTVADRLVQRRIAAHLHNRRLLPVYNSSSFGFIPQIGVRDAVARVLEYRSRYDWCFETDIIGFFDRIDRSDLKYRLKKHLYRSNILGLVNQAVDLEIRPTLECSSSKLENLGIRQNCGIRQGMPLSPILSNLALSEFDKAIEAAGTAMVRYADDIVVFASTKEQCLKAAELVVQELAKLGHSVPPLGPGSKTNIIQKFEPLTFLGRDIEFSDRYGMFVQKISKKKMRTVLSALSSLGDLDTLISNKTSFPDFQVKIAQFVSSYIMAYSDASNIYHFEYEMRRVSKESIKRVYAQIFGDDAIRNIDAKHQKFLGFDTIQVLEDELFDLF